MRSAAASPPTGTWTPSYLSLSPMTACAEEKAARQKAIGEALIQSAHAFSINMETNNVCSGHGGAKSWKRVSINVDQSGTGRVYASNGTYLGTVDVTSTGTATARIATCKDGTELSF